MKIKEIIKEQKKSYDINNSKNINNSENNIFIEKIEGTIVQKELPKEYKIQNYTLKVCDAKLKDETGTIPIILENHHTNIIQNMHMIRILNAYIKTFYNSKTKKDEPKICLYPTSHIEIINNEKNTKESTSLPENIKEKTRTKTEKAEETELIEKEIENKEEKEKEEKTTEEPNL